MDSYAASKGIQEVWVTGHSLGAGIANNLRDDAFGVFSNAKYVTFADPSVARSSSVLNIGFENDWVFKALPPWTAIFTPYDPISRADYVTTTDNIVWFDANYAGDNLIFDPITDVSAHDMYNYVDAVQRVISSAFYFQMDRDSTVILDAYPGVVSDKPSLTQSRHSTDRVFFIGQNVDDFLAGGSGADYVDGNGGADFITGGAGDDALYGGYGDDVLLGDDGVDMLVGGENHDNMTGGSGADTFADTPSGLNGDVIMDFATGDCIEVRGVQFQSDDVPFVVGVLEVDVNGDGVSDANINLVGDFTGKKFVATPSGTGAEVFTRITMVADEPDISIESPAPQDEGNAGDTRTYTFEVKRIGGDLTKPSTIDYRVAPGATDKDDFAGKVLPPPGQITIPADKDAATITITTSGDDDPESDETFHVVLTNADYGKIVKDTGDGIIRNDDNLPPEVSISALDTMKREGDSGSTEIRFEVRLDKVYSEPVDVNWDVYPYDHQHGLADELDFGGAWPGGSVTIDAGNISQEFSVLVEGDTDVEPNEWFTVRIAKPENATLGISRASSLIVDDDGPPALSIFPVDASKAEGNSGSTPFTFAIVRSGDPDAVVWVDWKVEPNLWEADIEDFGGTWPAGSAPVVFDDPAKFREDITVPVSGDTDFEPDESFGTLLVNPSPNATIDVNWGYQPGYIQNDDAQPGFSIRAVDANKNEGNSGTTDFVFEVTRSGNLEAAVTVDYGLSGNGANPADWGDFSGAVSGTLFFAADEAAKQIIIPVLADTFKEPDEGFKVSLSNPSPNQTIGTADAFGTILDDDVTRISIAPASASKKEGNNPSGTAPFTPFTFTVTRTGNLDVEDFVTYQTAATGTGSSRADEFDFGGLFPSGAVVFAAGESSKTITVKVLADNVPEHDEHFEVALTGINVLPSASRAPGTINDDDKTTISIVSTVSKAEGTDITPPVFPTLFKFPVTRSGNTDAPLTLSYTVSGGSGLPTGGTVVFNPGDKKQLIEIGVNPDNVNEPDETFTVTLTDPGTYGLSFGNKKAVGNIRDDDAPPPPVFRGDPHLVSFDGLAYDFQAAGEFVLAQGVVDSGIIVQARTEPVGDLVSNVTAVAMLIDGHRVTISAREAEPLRIDGVLTVLDPDGGTMAVGGGSVSLDGNSYVLDDPGRVRLVVDTGSVPKVLL